MTRLLLILTSTFLALAACTPVGPTTGADGQPVQRVYRIKAKDTANIQFRVLDSVNALRVAAGTGPLELDSQLTAAAATHARDMSVQNRPWHFGSDGSSPLDRVSRSGYLGELIGENISETYENESETIAAWMDTPSTREVILSPRAKKLGVSWFQEPNGKIWWTMVTGS
ncbi:MAG: CAP domain-containing protein [Litoreibacter sp.]|uniref:CAP domain-containing protein n=1 Tax=Litoreibacter sp. TaxID=1969459 RepID=UPI00329772DB